MALQIIVGIQLASGRYLFGNKITDCIDDATSEPDPRNDCIEIVFNTAAALAQVVEIDRGRIACIGGP